MWEAGPRKGIASSASEGLLLLTLRDDLASDVHRWEATVVSYLDIDGVKEPPYLYEKIE